MAAMRIVIVVNSSEKKIKFCWHGKRMTPPSLKGGVIIVPKKRRKVTPKVFVSFDLVSIPQN